MKYINSLIVASFAIVLAPSVSEACNEHIQDCSVKIEVNVNTQELTSAVCKEKGFKKLRSQAEAYGVDVDMDSIRITGYNDRSYGFGELRKVTVYTWWSVDVTDVKDRDDVFRDKEKPVLTKLVQYNGEECI